jgi:transglutaminase-like putative cysteine protease
MTQIWPILVAAIVLACGSPSVHSDAVAPKSRKLTLTNVTTVPEIPAGTKELVVWVPKALAETDQDVLSDSLDVSAGSAVVEKTEHALAPNSWYAVRITAPKAPIVLTQTIQVHRRETLLKPKGPAGRDFSKEERTAAAAHLGAHKLVPVSSPTLDPVIALVGPGLTDPVEIAKATYDFVLERMRYSKDGQGWGRGDSTWACDSRYGNCTDFHSLFMSIARAKGVPARFVMGYPIPSARGEGTVGGYHCWAEFMLPGGTWVPVDISEADKNPTLADYYFGNLTEDRIACMRGRDIALTPTPASGVQNFIIYALAEADGVVLKTERKLSYKDN